MVGGVRSAEAAGGAEIVMADLPDKGYVVWVTRSFLDYRVPVYAELNALIGDRLVVVYNGDYVPQRVQGKLRAVLGDRAVALHGERRIGPDRFGSHMANRAVRIPWQPGLKRTVTRYNPVLLISDGFFQWTAACLWLRATKKIPHVMCYERTAHTERHAQWYRALYRRRALAFVDAVCCSGQLCGAYVRSLGFSESSITYGHMVADVGGVYEASQEVDGAARSALRTQLQLEGVVFLYVGQLVSRKGILPLLCGWRRFVMMQTGVPVTLAIVGDGSGRRAAKMYSRDHSLDSVRFLGQWDYDAMATLYAAADCLVTPTLEDNWSLVVPEAMAAGLPILCSRYNGCWPELVREGVNGWVFDPLSAESTVGALKQALGCRDQLKSMGQASRQIVSHHTSWQAAASIYSACRIAVRGRDQDAMLSEGQTA
jgi:glycosyltransferase involved in cell wall biosynthesis